MYYERIGSSRRRGAGLPVLGYLPEPRNTMESRHLGLFLRARSIGCASDRAIGDQMEKSIAVDRVLEVAGCFH